MGLVNAKCLAAVVLAAATVGTGAVLLRQPAASATPPPSSTAPPEPTVEELKRENERLRREVARLNKRLAEFVGSPLDRDDPTVPTDQEALRALAKEGANQTTVSGLLIVKEKLLDRLGPVRCYPLVGVAQLRSVHWKCTAYLEPDANGPPSAGKKKESRAHVAYIDKAVLVSAADRSK
jgi:transposase-like protein